MKLEVGKRYVMRDGAVTGPLRLYEKTGKWLCDDRSAITWLANGGHWRDADTVNARDIVAEYVEPQPLRWVANCKPDKPGLWLLLHSDGQSDTLQIEAFHIPQAYLHLYSSRTYCYLGPIPEILPPKKKVVERLCMKPVTDMNAVSGSLYEAEWIAEGTVIHSDWIRTDETREVER